LGGAAGDHEEETIPQGVEPGRLTALLEEIAAAPEGESGTGWEAALRAGDTVGKFELVRELGRGGFGIVWEARDRELGRTVALKAVRVGRQDALREKRLLLEAEAAARLSHPNIVTLFDAGRTPTGPYLVLELLRGETLAARLSRGPLPAAEAIRVGIEIARGLAHAHARGVVHRDLKPANVFLCEDRQVKVLDLGLAHVFGRGYEVAGTSGYMAPEQRDGAPEDERTDVFALGVVLYETVAGEQPFRAGRRRAPALDVSEAPALSDLVERMLSERPVDRPRHGAEVLESLLALSFPSRGAPSPPPARSKRHRSRTGGRVFVAGIALVGCALVAGAAWQMIARHDAGARERTGVAIADFANDTGEPQLDGLSGLLITSLEQSRKLRVLTRSRMFDVLKEMGKTDVERIDEPLAREIGRRTNACALLHASVRKLGGVYVVELRALDPVRDEYLFALRETADGPSALLGVIDRLSERVRAELREPVAEIRASETRVASAITTDLGAYEHYFRGQQLYDQTKLLAAIAEYRKSLEKDPGFALAHYGISVCMRYTGGSNVERRAHADAAAAAADRLPEKEGLLVRAWQARVQGRLDAARATYARLVERFPEDKEALVWAANTEANSFLDSERALALYERAFRIDPTSILIREHVAGQSMRLGRLDEAAAFVRAREAGWPAGPCLLAAIELNRGRAEAAQEAADRCADAAPEERTILFWVHVMREDLAAASADVVAIQRSGGRTEAAWLSAYHALARGRIREAVRLGHEAATLEERVFDTAVLGVNRFVPLLAASGRGPALRRAVLEAQVRAHTNDLEIPLLIALVGDYELARQLLTVTPPQPQWERTFIDCLSRRSERGLDATRAALVEFARSPLPWRRQAAAYALAETCSLAKDARCVLEAAGSFRFTTNEDLESSAPLHVFGWPRVLLWSAQAHEALGEREQAREEVERLLGRWKDADPDVPGLADAKALHKRLRAWEPTPAR
jgi:eukaryotic-like serine/threonine-protein kinase